MPTINIDNHAYELGTLSQEARAQLASLQFVDAELARLQAQAAVLRTARGVYAQKLAASMPTTTASSTSVQGSGRILAVPNPHAADALPAWPLNAPKVLLVTYEWSTLTEMAHLVGQAGCWVDVLCPEGSWAIKNSFYTRWIDAGATLESLIEVLRVLNQDQIYEHILIGDDPILWKIYRDKDVALWPLLPVENPLALPILGKIGLAEHCRAHGISAPDFCRVDNPQGASGALALLGLPLVVKEIYSNGGQGVKVFQDAAAYHVFMAAYDYAEPLLAQQFIAGQLIGVEALFKHGRLLEFVNSAPIDPNLGPSSKRRYFANDDRVAELVVKIGQSAGLHGFANITMLRDSQSQTLYLFEADPRPNKWTPYARWFGRDFVSAFKAFMQDKDEFVYMHQSRQAVQSCDVACYPDYASELFTSNRANEAVFHLLAFENNYRFTLYDPVLLKAKMDALRSTLAC